VSLRALFPYFGGKSQVASQVWALFGNVSNYVEPFAGSLAVLLARPSPFSGAETVNDADCHVVNVWRAIVSFPDELSELLVAPVAEVNTEAQHNALVRGAGALRDALGDPNFCDVEKAAWWIKGANEWIGSGWCTAEGPWVWTPEGGWQTGKGINRQLPHLGNAGQFEARRVSLLASLCAFRDRLCGVRIACGDWSRVLGESVTVKHGVTAVFLDPPYDGTEYVYAKSGSVSSAVREWCAANGGNRLLRIVLAGRGEEHDALILNGWRKELWSARRGYAKHEERKSEALWVSPFCINRKDDLF